MSLLLGINGEIASGKTTITDYLTLRKHVLKSYAFADPLKDIAIKMGFEYHQAYGTQEQKLETNKFWGINCRKFLQVFGSEVCRDYLPKVLPDMNFNGNTVWVRLFEKFRMECPNINTVVGDVRFKDESDKIKELGGYIIRVERENGNTNTTNTTNTVDMDVEEPDAKHTSIDEEEYKQHQSELQAAFIKPDIVIRNNGTIEQLYAKVEEAIKQIQSGILKNHDMVMYM